MMYCPIVFSKMRKFRFSTRVIAIILSLMVLLIVSEGVVQSVTTTGEIHSGNLNRFNGVSDYKISNNPFRNNKENHQRKNYSYNPGRKPDFSHFRENYWTIHHVKQLTIFI